MKGVSVKTSMAYEFLVHQTGGYPFVGFTLKDLYNKLDGDAQSSVAWMNIKALRDPHFYCIFSVDENGRDVNPASGSKVISLTQYGKAERQWTVWYQPDKQNPTFICSCMLFQSDGIPCCHIFTTIKFEMITSFSDSLVNKRWIKEVSKKKKLPNTANASDKSL
ncbi:hypothetical protein M0R45_009339 [Rubus argutus]|uniref:SWIM-type domain-containing protein n=1 Tax=Rubus argutus TaxID=59490 RepID=A0AAW1Y3D6_RUBAR